MSDKRRHDGNNPRNPGKTGEIPRFGAHMSVAGGLEHAFDAGAAVGCDCLQIFVKNHRQWRATSPVTDEQIRLFREARCATGLAPVVAHAGYLLNLASPNDATRAMSVSAMFDELTRCEALGLEALVFHPGAHLRDECRMANSELRMTEGETAGIDAIAASLDEVHRRCAGYRTMILLETTAGQGTAIGWHFGQLAAILDRVGDSGRLGVCLDTCHLFAAGYDFRTAEGYAGMIDELDRTIGVSRVRCIHTNDSKKDLGSRVDRHEHIGKGKIGKAGFARFVNDPRFVDVPFILETPKGKDGRGTDLDKVNLRRLRSLIVD